MQFFQNFLTNWKILLQSLLERKIEPLVKIVERIENTWH